MTNVEQSTKEMINDMNAVIEKLKEYQSELYSIDMTLGNCSAFDGLNTRVEKIKHAMECAKNGEHASKDIVKLQEKLNAALKEARNLRDEKEKLFGIPDYKLKYENEVNDHRLTHDSLDKSIELLDMCEWVARNQYGHECCPICNMVDTMGHEKDCELHHLIKNGIANSKIKTNVCEIQINFSDEEQTNGEGPAKESDGCPIEGAVLKREWRRLTSQLTASQTECERLRAEIDYVNSQFDGTIAERNAAIASAKKAEAECERLRKHTKIHERTISRQKDALGILSARTETAEAQAKANANQHAIVCDLLAETRKHNDQLKARTEAFEHMMFQTETKLAELPQHLKSWSVGHESDEVLLKFINEFLYTWAVQSNEVKPSKPVKVDLKPFKCSVAHIPEHAAAIITEIRDRIQSIETSIANM